MYTLFIDTHCSKKFAIAKQKDDETKFMFGTNTATQIIPYINELTNNQISQIIIISGPGSLTGLRIGSSTALGLASGTQMRTEKNIPIKALSIWQILLAEYENTDIFFYTGTKKWIKKNTEQEEIIESNFQTNKSWISNNTEKLNLDMKKNIPYPEIIKLMPKYKHLATNDINLIYSVTLF